MLIQYAYHGIVRSLKPIMRMLASQMHISECVPVGQAHHICIPTTPLPHNCEMLMNEDVYLTSVDRACCQEASQEFCQENVAWWRRFCHINWVCQCIVHVQHVFVSLRSCTQHTSISENVDLYICVIGVRNCLFFYYFGFQSCRGRSACCGLDDVYTGSRFTYTQVPCAYAWSIIRESSAREARTKILACIYIYTHVCVYVHVCIDLFIYLCMYACDMDVSASVHANANVKVSNVR